MATVSVSFTTKKQSVPAAPAASGNIKCYLKQGAITLQTGTASVATPSCTFTSVPDGEYIVEAQRMSMSNTPIGDLAVSSPFTVVNMTEIDVPDLVSVSM